MSGDRARIEWMDVMRGGAIILVIAYHSSAILELIGAPVPATLRAANDALSPYRMPALMFLSGLLLPKSLSKSMATYYWGKVRHALYPFILWTVAYGVVVGIDAHWYSPQFWIASSYLWFLQFIIVYYAVAPLVVKLPAWLYALLPLVLAWFAETDSVLQRFLFMSAFFFFGNWAGQRVAMVHRVVASRWTWLLAAPVVAFSALSVASGPMRYRPELALLTLSGVVLAMKLADAVAGAPIATPLKFVGRKSVVFYCTHFIVIYAILILAVNTWGFPVEVSVVAGFVVSVCVGTGCALMPKWTRMQYVFEMPNLKRNSNRVSRWNGIGSDAEVARVAPS